MTEHEELLYLREKIQKLQTEAETPQGQDQIAKPAPAIPLDEPEEDTKVAEEPELSPVIESNVPATKEKIIPPKRDEAIPPHDMREKKSVKEIRADLAAELKGVKLPKKKVTDSAQPQDVKDREEKVDNLLKKK